MIKLIKKNKINILVLFVLIVILIPLISIMFISNVSGFTTNLTYIDMDNESNLFNKGNLLSEPIDTNNYVAEYETGLGFSDNYAGSQLTTDEAIYLKQQIEIETESDAFKVFSGNYTSSYSFDNDLETDGFYDNIYGTMTGTVQIIDTFQGHDNVLEIHDTGTGYVNLAKQFKYQEFGSVEFWMSSSTNLAYANFVYLRTDSVNSFVFCFSTGYIKVYYAGAYHDLTTYDINTWYHIRIDFECGTNGYMNLASDTGHVYINGIRYSNIPFNTVGLYISGIVFDTSGSSSGYYGYYDALGFSFETGINYNGIDDNIVYDNLIDYTGLGGTTTVLDCYKSHSTVIELHDTHVTNNIEDYLYFQGEIEHGTIEFWMLSTKVSAGTYSIVSLHQDTTILIDFAMENSKFRHVNYLGAWSDISGAPTVYSDAWYHIRIDFECLNDGYLGLSSDTYKITINGINCGSYLFRSSVNANYANTLRFHTYGVSYYEYFDALGIYPYFPINNLDAVYTFDSDSVGSNPTNWTVIESGGSVNIYNEGSFLNNVVEFSKTTTGNIGMYQTITSFYPTENNEFEFWIKTTDNGKQLTFEYSNAINRVFFYMTSINLIENEWNHVKVKLGYPSYTYFTVYTNGIETYQSSLGAYPSNPNSFRILTSTTSEIFDFYIDLVDYSHYASYDDDYDNIIFYEIGQNLETFEINSYVLGTNMFSEYLDNSEVYELYQSISTFDFGVGITDNTFEIYYFINELETEINIYHNSELYKNETIETFPYMEINIDVYYGIYNFSFGNQFNLRIEIYNDTETDNIIFSYEQSEIVLDYVSTDSIIFDLFEIDDIEITSSYSWNIFKKLRTLCDESLTREYKGFISSFRIDDILSITSNELIPPTEVPYHFDWRYQKTTLDFDTNETLTTANFEYAYPLARVNFETVQFPNQIFSFSDSIIGGFWGIFDGLRIGLNFIIKVIVDFFANLIIVPIQFFLFLLTLAWNTLIFGYIIGGLIILVWNILLKYLCFAGIWFLEGLILLLPSIEWIFEYAVPWFVDTVLYFASWIIAIVFWAFSGGKIDIQQIQTILNDMMNVVFDFMYDLLLEVIHYLPEVLVFLTTIVYLLLWLYLKRIYVESRGWVNRSAEIQKIINLFVYAFNQIVSFLKKLWDMIPWL